MKPIITSTVGDKQKVEFVDQVRSEEQKVIEFLTEENKRLREAGDKLHDLLIHMDFSEWEETHDPDVDKYEPQAFFRTILNNWQDAKAKTNESEGP